MKIKPFFSVIIPVYNREGFIAKSVSSVLNQSFGDFELITVDDGSRDGTPEVLNSFTDPRLRRIRLDKNSGVSAARNRGIEAAQGEYAAFLDSDDWWLKDKLLRTREAIEEYPDIMVFHTLEKWYRGGKLLNQKKKHRPPSGEVFERCLRLCCISMSTAVVKKGVFESVGCFDESLPACEDYDFWLRVGARHRVFLIEEALTEKEGGHPGQQSRRYPAMDRFRIYSIEKILKSGELGAGQYDAAVSELRRKCRIYAEGALKRGHTGKAREFLEKPRVF